MIDRQTFDTVAGKMGDEFVQFFDATKFLLAADATSKFMREGKGEGGTRNTTDTLRIITGRLARSLVDAEQSGAGSREGIFEIEDNKMRFGSRTPYAAVHEDGFSGNVIVPAHTRTIRQAFGRQIEPRQVQVREHSRFMNIPARPYLKPALKGLQDQLAQDLSKRVTQIIIESVDES